MIVRVYIPKQRDPADGSDADGFNFEFPVLPQPGQKLRLSDPDSPDYEVESVSFIQDENAFIPCVWMKREVDIDGRIEALKQAS